MRQEDVIGALRKLFISLVLFLLVGCEVSKSDLVGTWVLTTDTRESLPRNVADATGKLSLQADGTFNAFDLPLNLSTSEMSKISGTGRWSLGRSGDQVVRIQFSSIGDGIPTSSGTGLVVSVFGGPHLVYYRDDPDLGNGIYYERVIGPDG